MYFRRTNAGTVPLEVLRSLEIPMPEEVMEQFIFDHGTKEEFQRQYGHLDLHALKWDLLSIPAEDILACSVYPPYASLIKSVAASTRVVPTGSWDDVPFPPTALEHWQTHGSWMRPPIMLRGELVGSDWSLHLVEGHTRIGTLRGRQESGLVLPRTHFVWLGTSSSPPENDGPWRDVLRTERMPFLPWLMDQVRDDGDIGCLASRLIDVKHSSASRVKIEGDDLESVLAYADAYPSLTQFKALIQHAHSEWEHLLSGLIGPSVNDSKSK